MFACYTRKLDLVAMLVHVFQEALAKSLDMIAERDLVDRVGIVLLQIAESSDSALYVSAQILTLCSVC